MAQSVLERTGEQMADTARKASERHQPLQMHLRRA